MPNINKNIVKPCALALMMLLGPLSGAALPQIKETALSTGSWKIGFGLKNMILYQMIDEKDPLDVKLPDYLLDDRADFYAGERDLTDNPLFHGAVLTRLSVNAVNRGLSVSCELNLEHRGMSYGTYDMDNIAVFPKMRASLDSSFALADEEVLFGVSAGNFDDYILYEGLTVHNADVQGVSAYLAWKKIRLSYSQIGDLDYIYGLNINEVYDFSASLLDLNIYGLAGLNARAGFTRNDLVVYHDGVSTVDQLQISASLKSRGFLRIYSELGVRDPGEGICSDIVRCAHLLGIEGRREWDRLHIGLTAERRYYGRDFNLHYKSSREEFKFRDYYSPVFGNTVGDYLYPLSLFDRPFSQWSIYTEYQGRDVMSLILRFDGRYDLARGFYVCSMLDFNYIEVSNEDGFLYPFYDIGVGWAPENGVFCLLTYTNRGMNLDEQYPTIYLLEGGLIQLKFGAELTF